MDGRRFLSELKTRGVYRVATIYAAGAWALLQVADLLFPMIGMPDWSVTAVLGVAAVCFPFAMVLAWLFDITPQGVVEAPIGTDIPETSHWSSVRWIEFGLIAALIVLVGFLYFDRLSSTAAQAYSRADPAPSSRPSIAVMPFVNMSGVVDMEYFGDGLAEEILNLLAGLSELDVAARTSSFYFKNRAVDIKAIGSHLGVEHVLEGSVRHHGERVRVQAQLVNTVDGFQLWSESYDRPLTDLLALQLEIAGKVVENLQVLLSAASRSTLARNPQRINPAAYDYFLQGRAYLRRPPDSQSVVKAEGMFRKAVALDERFAEAWAGVCDSLLGQYRLSLSAEHFTGAEEACNQALALDGHAIGVYVALGNLYRSSGQYARAREEFGKALAINSRAVDAHDGLGQTYIRENALQQAEDTFAQVIELQPNYWQGYTSMGNFLVYTGRADEAVPFYQRLTELMPESESSLNNLGAAYYLSGRFSEATDTWQRSVALQPSAFALSNIGSALFFLGRFDEAVDVYHQALEMAPEHYEWWGNLGDAYRFSSHSEGLSEPMYRRAIELAQQHLKVNPASAETLALMGHYYANIGDSAAAEQHLVEAETLEPRNMYVYYTSSTARVALGDVQAAMGRLEQALELGFPPAMARADAGLSALNNLPQFEALTATSE